MRGTEAMGLANPDSEVRSTWMTKDLVALYHALLERAREALGIPDVYTARSRLYSLLLRKPLDPKLEAVLKDLGVSASYARTHLLSIGSWPVAVRDAMRLGLPYQDARRIAQLDEADQDEVLRLFRGHHGRLPGKASAAARVRERELAHARTARTLPLTADGWVAAAENAVRPERVLAGTHVYTDSDAPVGDEALPRGVVEGLVATYTSAGGAVADPLAGGGSTAIAAHVLRRWSWSGDIKPRYPFIHPVDAADRVTLMDVFARVARPIDLVIVHPPLWSTWTEEGVGRTIERYEAWASCIVANAVGLVKRGGFVAVIVQPLRAQLSARLITDTAAQALSLADAVVVGYHVVVELRGAGEWHIVVGRTLD